MKLNVPVEEYTTPNPVTATEDAPIEELRKLMDEHGIRHLPIVRGNAVVGVVSDRDVRLGIGVTAAHDISLRAADIMSTDPLSVKATRPLDEVAYLMSDRKIGSVIVNDESGELLGIFTVTDALNALIEITRSAGGDE